MWKKEDRFIAIEDLNDFKIKDKKGVIIESKDQANLTVCFDDDVGGWGATCGGIPKGHGLYIHCNIIEHIEENKNMIKVNIIKKEKETKCKLPMFSIYDGREKFMYIKESCSDKIYCVRLENMEVIIVYDSLEEAQCKISSSEEILVNCDIEITITEK